MSALVAAMNAAARKLSAIDGIKGAAGADTAIEMPDTPFAIVYLNPGSVTQGTFTDYSHEFEVRIYLPKASLPQGYGILAGFFDKVEVAWRTNRDMDGTVVDSFVRGHGKVDLESWGSAEYLVIPIYVGVLRTAAADLTT